MRLHLAALSILLVALPAPVASQAPMARDGGWPRAPSAEWSRSGQQTPPDGAAIAVGDVFWRGTFGAVAGLLGMFGGALVTAVVYPRTCGDFPCDPVVVGAIVGGVGGTAFGASALRMRSDCDFGHRFPLALAGTGVGAALGLLTASASGGLTIPLATAAGAAVGATLCHQGG